MDRSMHVVGGKPWQGHKVSQGAVTICTTGRKQPKGTLAPFFMVPCPVDLLRPGGDTKPLIELVKQIRRQGCRRSDRYFEPGACWRQRERARRHRHTGQASKTRSATPANAGRGNPSCAKPLHTAAVALDELVVKDYDRVQVFRQR
jgi:hypothetical protein